VTDVKAIGPVIHPMNWKIKFLILIIVAVPAFIGYPVSSFESEILSGVAYGWVVYFLVINAIVFFITGKKFYPNVLAIAVLIAMPVVFVGAAVSYFIFLFGLGYESGPTVYGSHYVSLCITMLTVIPLALTMVAVIPFQDLEQILLIKAEGVSRIEKFALMFLRVFNHIVFFVIPNIVETMREEAQYRKWAESSLKSESSRSVTGSIRFFRTKSTGLARDMVQVGVEGICASIQYIPLWAVEISQLPDRSKSDRRRIETDY
jgi:hypothetical protein